MNGVLQLTTAMSQVTLHVASDGARKATGESSCELWSESRDLPTDHASDWFPALSCGWELLESATAELHNRYALEADRSPLDRAFGQVWVVDTRLVLSVSAIPAVFNEVWELLKHGVGHQALELLFAMHLQEPGTATRLRAMLEFGERLRGNCGVSLRTVDLNDADPDD